MPTLGRHRISYASGAPEGFERQRLAPLRELGKGGRAGPSCVARGDDQSGWPAIADGSDLSPGLFRPVRCAGHPDAFRAGICLPSMDRVSPNPEIVGRSGGPRYGTLWRHRVAGSGAPGWPSRVGLPDALTVTRPHAPYRAPARERVPSTRTRPSWPHRWAGAS